MRKPKKVRIIKNNEGNGYYDQYIGREVNVISYENEEYYLPLPEIGDYDSPEPVTIWYTDEVEVIEWEEPNPTLKVVDVNIGDDIKFEYLCNICGTQVDGGDNYCRNCGIKLEK